MEQRSSTGEGSHDRSRRRFLATAAVGAGTLFAGCAGSSDDSGSGSGGSSGGSGETESSDESETEMETEGGSESDYPTDNIRFIIPYDPGGGVDFWARGVFPTVGEILGVSFQFENVSGASGTRGFSELARAEPDGYTVAMDSQGYAEIAHLTHDTNYEWTAFETGGVVTEATREVIFANPDLGIEGWEDLFGRYESGELDTFGVGDEGGSLSASFLMMQRDGTLPESVSKVAYTGSGPTVEAVVTGEVPAGIATDTSVAGQGFVDELDVLGTVTEDASQIVDPADHVNPDALSLQQAGYPAYQRLGQYNYGLYWPDGTPESHIKTVAEAMNQAMQREDLQQWAQEAGNVLGPYRTPEEHETIRDETWQAFQELDLEALQG
jgi:tripartite-type tricarboxylate transporter receptor subunit TctC